ncbi:MAG: 2-C-methyl-D-erythritol 4-phosphate cytidylyltransferase, partial [Pseudomonadota bacterium]
MGVIALVVAAGRGTRAGGPLPKQYQRLGTETVLTKTLRTLLGVGVIDQVAVVIHKDDQSLYERAVASVQTTALLPPVEGGDTRAASVRNGLEALSPHAPDHVLIHDAARPFAPAHMIEAVVDAL